MQKGSLNKVQLIGHLGADPESRFTTSGSAVTNFNLATNESWKSAEGDAKGKNRMASCRTIWKNGRNRSRIHEKRSIGIY